MNKQLESGIVDIEKNRLYILEIKTNTKVLKRLGIENRSDERNEVDTNEISWSY